MAQQPEAFVAYMGDFNSWLDPALDRHRMSTQTWKMGTRTLKRFDEEVGLIDVWKTRNPYTINYSWFTNKRGYLSCIDLLMGNDKVLPFFITVEYLARGISNHSPLLFGLSLYPRGRRQVGRIQPFWLPQIGPMILFLINQKCSWRHIRVARGTAFSGIHLRHKGIYRKPHN